MIPSGRKYIGRIIFRLLLAVENAAAWLALTVTCLRFRLFEEWSRHE
jgi:hypothetical protein